MMSVFPASLWLKSTWALPDPMNLTTATRLSISTSSPTRSSSAFSPNLRSGTIRSSVGSLPPHALSGGSSAVFFSPTSILAISSSRPFSTQSSPTETRRGSYLRSAS